MSVLHTNSIITTLEKAQKLETLSGFRLVKIIRKDSKDKITGNTIVNVSMGAVVPSLTKDLLLEALSNEILEAYLLDALEAAQDKIIRSVVEKGETVISHEALNLECIAAHLESIGEGEGRISADSIKAWFTSEVRDSLIIAFADLNGISATPTEAELERLEKVANAYRDSMSSLAGRTLNSIPVAVAVKLEKAIGFAPDSAWKNRMLRQLDKLVVKAGSKDDLEGL